MVDEATIERAADKPLPGAAKVIKREWTPSTDEITRELREAPKA